MIKQRYLDGLLHIVGHKNVLTSNDDLVAYSYDASVSWSHLPDVVVLPENAEQISRILKLASEYSIPVTPRGGGTNMSGGSIPINGGIVLSTAKMKRIIEINKTNLNAIVEPGVILEDFNIALAKEGLFFPPDPQSSQGCTMGGVISENSGGPSCLKYGVTRQYILGLEVVLADGTIVKLGGVTPKNRTGYEMAILFAGSEGTLGVITKISLRVLPAPKATQSLLVAFENVAAGSDAVSAIISSGILPCRIEFCNGPEWQKFITEKLVLGVHSVLLIQVDGLPGTVDIEARQIIEVCKGHKAIDIVSAKNSAEEEAFWDLRRQAFAIISQRFPVRISEDVCVPRDKMTEFIQKMKEMSKRHGVNIGFGGHAGDGNFHPGVALDVNDQDQQRRARECIDELVDTAVSLGGVISGEHGIGLEKQKFLRKAMDPAAYNLMKKIKSIFDPDSVLNPGKIWKDSSDEDYFPV